MCGTTVCDKCLLDITVECTPVEQDCCEHDKELSAIISAASVSQQTLGGNNYSLYTATVTLNGGLVPYQQIKAEVIDYQLISTNEECLSCKSKPFTWASISASTLAGIIPLTAGVSPSIGFNIPANPSDNPREVIWENGSPISLNAPQQVSINLYLPAASTLECCELKVKVCIRFTFTDTSCRQCEKIICETIVLKAVEK